MFLHMHNLCLRIRIYCLTLYSKLGLLHVAGHPQLSTGGACDIVFFLLGHGCVMSLAARD